MFFSIYSSLSEAEDPSLPDYNRTCFHDYMLGLIEEIHNTGSDWQDRINILKGGNIWLDTVGLFEPTGLNKNLRQDILESAGKNNTMSLVLLFSRTGNMASRIMNKYFIY